MRGVFNNEKGIALIITLLVITLLTALIVEFAYSARVNLSAAGNFRDKQKAYYLAKSGVNFIGERLKYNKKNGKEDDINQMLPPVTVGDGIVTVKFVDESAKIYIKNIKNNPTAQTRLERLFEILNISFSLLEAIKEREGEYNLLSELRLVSGMTDEVYDKVKDYITVYGDGNININEADAIVLRCLSADITEDIAQRIIAYRQKNLFKEPVEIKNVVGVSPDFNTSGIVTKSNHFSVISTGIVNDVENRIDAVLERRSATEVKRLYWRSL